MAENTIPMSELASHIGEETSVSDWFTVTQDMVNAFAETTLDKQWIHIDSERAAKESPFGSTVAHGFLTLSLIPHLLGSGRKVTGMKMAVNYGLNRLRFPAPVLVGTKIQAKGCLQSVEEIPGCLHVVTLVTIQAENQEKPVCVAECVARYYS
jgi:acyl dehydratase